MSELSTEERIKSQLQNLFGDKPAESANVWNYRKAAAVIEYFNFDEIRPVDGEAERDGALESLYDASEVVYDENRQPQRALNEKIRREALEMIFRESGVQGFQKALAANPNRPQSRFQKLFEAYLSGSAPPLTDQSRLELVSTAQIADWIYDIVEIVPDPVIVRGLIEIESLLAPFKYLLGVTPENPEGTFFGREQEIKKLYEYVGMDKDDSFDLPSAPPHSRRIILDFFNFGKKPPLVIHAPGGTGKSTLIAKFVLDHARYKDSDSYDRFPFVYLNFDKPSIKPEEPITLLLEAVQQLAVQYPEHRDLLVGMHEEWLRTLSAAVRLRSSPSANKTEPQIENRQAFIEAFASVVNNRINTKEYPILFLLDTFEEAQWRSQAFVEGILKFLEDMQRNIPKLRTVISGRAEVKSNNYSQIENYQLPPFDPAAAQLFLEKSGVEDPGIAAEIVKQIGGSPLTLRLAAQLYKLNEVDNRGIKNLDLKETFLKRLKEESIQAMLYRRILDHIHTEDVQRLANPGLLLRRITPELISEVLAEPCKIDVSDPTRPRELFEELRREITLVTEAGQDVLVHRRDIRNLMLGLLKDDKAINVRQIHQNAVKYYKKFDDDASRSEEIYHRLSLDWDRKEMDERWRSNLPLSYEDLLELPPRSQGYLAAHMQIEVDESVWESADFEDWERYAIRSARELIKVDRPDDALMLVRKRKDRIKSQELLAIEREIEIKKERLKEYKGEGFTKAVFMKMSDWYAPQNLIHTAQKIILGLFSDQGGTGSAALPTGAYFDYSAQLSRTIDDFAAMSGLDREEMWIDYVADVGDGWNSTYSVAYNLARPDLQVKNIKNEDKGLDTKRGELLIFGGDLVYPTADMQNYRHRLIVPYQMAFKSTGKKVKSQTGDFVDLKNEPQVFAIPGWHDWEDRLYSFKKIFCSFFYNNRSFADGWQTRQKQSYFALKLPHKWWLLGFDLYLGQRLDENQLQYFESVCQQMSLGDKVILCVQDPYWVRDIKYQESGFYVDSGNWSIDRLEDFLARRGVSISVYLAGGVHHYRRFENTEGVQKITAGGGGAFLQPTHDFDFEKHYHYKDKSSDDSFVSRSVYPSPEQSRRYDWQLLYGFILKNPRFGIITAFIYSMLAWLIQWNIEGEFSWQNALKSVINGLITEPLAAFFLIGVLVAVIFFTDSTSKFHKYLGGLLHGFAHLTAIFILSGFSYFLTRRLFGNDLFFMKDLIYLNYSTTAILVWFSFIVLICGIGGYIIGSFIMGIYLFISLHFFGRHDNEAFSAMKIEDYKNFLRMKIDKDGTLTIYPFKIDRVARKWREIFEYYEPADLSSIQPELIEPPIVVK
jgi:hypothetical protein